MKAQIGNNARRLNSALKPFEILIGEWKTTGSHPLLPNTELHGFASFEWIEGGAFLILRSEIDEPRFPDGIEIFGSDDVAKKFFMLHFDERGVSRKFDVTIHEQQITWTRDEPTFSQQYVLSIEEGGNKLVSKGEASKNGAAWEKDLDLTYLRLKK